MDLLQASGSYFRDAYPGVTPEAVGAFILTATGGAITVGALAEALHVPPAQMMDHLNLLVEGQGAGLIRIDRNDGGDDSAHGVQLTHSGMIASHELISRLER